MREEGGINKKILKRREVVIGNGGTKNTALMGAGVVVCSDGEIIVVSNYNLPGNYMGEFSY